MIEVFVKLIKFGFVGLSGMGVDFSFTYLCKEKLKIQKFISNSIGFIFAASSNYLLNRIWTFNSTNSNVAQEYFTYVSIASIGLLINNAILYFFNEKQKLHFYLSKVFAILITVLWNFTANFFFNFN